MGNDRRPRDEHNDRTVVERVDPLVGSVLDNRFRIDFRIAAGGFGAIYRATHVKSGHQVALKVLHTDLATSDARVIARFRREGATLVSLRDPHTITAYELGEPKDGPLYIVMELLDGESLFEQFRAHGPLAWQRVAAIGRMVCSSLAEAHALGIVHRDLKPANIHLEKRDGNPDFVKVLDFGIAKILRDSDFDSSELTQAGQMIGTFDYMAPEQMLGAECTSGTDIYTLGIVMYEMIAGVRPFADAQTPTSMLAALLTSNPPPLSQHVEVPTPLEHIIMRCLERERQNRFADVRELAAALDELLVPQAGVTARMAATPPPVLHDEVTVIDSGRESRAKRESSPPHVVRRDGSAPHPVVVRRDGSAPHPVVIRREASQPVKVPLDLDQTMPLNRSEPDPRSARPADPWAAQAAIEQRARRDSAPIAPRPSQVAIEQRARRESSQPSLDPRAQPLDPRAQPLDPRAQPLDPRAQPLDPRAQPIDPRYVPPPEAPPIFHPLYAHGAQPTVDPVLVQPYPSPVPDPRASMPMLAWQTPRPPSYPGEQRPSGYIPARGSAFDVQSYDMSNVHGRDVVVRRVVWTLAIVLGIILAIVVVTHL